MEKWQHLHFGSSNDVKPIQKRPDPLQFAELKHQENPRFSCPSSAFCTFFHPVLKFVAHVQLSKHLMLGASAAPCVSVPTQPHLTFKGIQVLELTGGELKSQVQGWSSRNHTRGRQSQTQTGSSCSAPQVTVAHRESKHACTIQIFKWGGGVTRERGRKHAYLFP